MTEHYKGNSDAEICIQPVAMLETDLDKYRADFADYGLTEAQETALLQTLWNIMCTFVEMGMDMNVDICGQFLDGFNAAATDDSPDDKILIDPAAEATGDDNGKEISE